MKTRMILLGWLLSAGLSAQAQPIYVVTETTAYSYLRDAQVAGPATEVVESSLRLAGLSDYQVHLYPWARAYDMALKDPNVLIYLIARTPARESQFQWAGEIMKIQYHLYKLKDRAVAVHQLQDAKQYTIGVMRDDVRHNYLKEKGFTRLLVSATQVENFRRLLTAKVDLLPLPDDDALFLCKETQISCDLLEKIFTLEDMSTGLYMAYSLATPEAIVEKTRLAFEKLRASGEVKRLMAKKP